MDYPKEDEMWKYMTVNYRNITRSSVLDYTQDGDTYLVTLVIVDERKFLEKFGKLPKETEKEYVVHFDD